MLVKKIIVRSFRIKKEENGSIVTAILTLAIPIIVFFLSWLTLPLGIEWFFGILLFAFFADTLAELWWIVIVGILTKSGNIKPSRTISLFAFCNVPQIIVSFAVFYIYTNTVACSNCGNLISSPLEALYFSVVTITSLGYGDMQPYGGMGRLLASLEVLTGINLFLIALPIFLRAGIKKDGS